MAKKKETKSLLQQGADNLRQLKESMTEYEGIEQSLAKDVEQAELELVNLRNKLEDTRSLIYAQKEKLQRDASTMHYLLNKSVEALPPRNDCPY